MTLTLAEKLKQLRLAQSFQPSQEKFALTLGVSRASLSKYETGWPVPDHILQLIATKTGVPLAWFLDGRDTPVPTSKAVAPISAARPSGDLSNPAILRPSPLVLMKFAGSVPAGDWGDPLASDEEVAMDVRFFDEKRYVTTVTGSSCFPALMQGDTAIWHEDLSPPPGLIVLAQRKHDHGCTVKQLIINRDGGFALRPLNPEYAFDLEGIEGWGVIARLVAVIREFDGVEISWFQGSGLRPRHLLGHIPKEEDIDTV